MPEVKAEPENRSCLSIIWNKWLSFCLTLHSGLEIVFQKIAKAVAKRPKLTIALSLLFVAALSAGIHRYKMEKRSDRLFIPLNSRSMKDLEKASPYFKLKTRLAEVIITMTDQGSVLTENVFKKALEIHTGITQLGGYQDACLQKAVNSQKSCTTLNALELFNYNSSLLTANISVSLNQFYNNPNKLMSNLKKARLNFPKLFGLMSFDNSGNLKSAASVGMLYFMKYHETDELYETIMAWESRFIEYLQSKESELKKNGIQLYFYAHRSLDDSISESALNDLKLMIAAFALMISFCVAINIKIRRPVNGHVLLAMGGILTVFLGIGSSFGLVMYTSTPFIGIVGVLPFMVLGVGIDDMFILVDTLDQRQSSIRGNTRLVATLSCAGSSILMTTLTDLIAFVISTVTDFKGIEYFCLYAALSISFVFILMVTFFLALMKIDIDRVESCKRDPLPCIKEEIKENPWYMEKSSISARLMFTWGKILMKTPVRIAVLLTGMALLAVSIYGTTFLDQSFDSSTLGKDSSYQKRFYDIKRKYYGEGLDVNIVVIGEHNYSDPVIQHQYLNLSQIARDNPKYQDYSLNWLEDYIGWSKQEPSRSIAGLNFTNNLPLFLNEPNFTVHKLHLSLSPDSGKISASRAIVRTKNDHNSIFKKDAMLSLRSELDNACCLKAFPIALNFIYYEQFVIILRDTIRNLAVSGSAVFVVTLPYLIHPGVTFVVLIGFVSLIFELLAVMYIWSVSLNSISMIVIVMAIGFSVDYSAHIAHAYVVSTTASPEERMIDALKTMGASVAMGGFSTFLGMLVTAFASSEVFRIFFKMVFTIVVLGLLHGLVFLPVQLSLFCRTQIFLPEEHLDNDSLKELASTPEKTNSVFHSPGHKSSSGQIGSKVIPVSPKKSSTSQNSHA